jgi:hypothetical protein
MEMLLGGNCFAMERYAIDSSGSVNNDEVTNSNIK